MTKKNANLQSSPSWLQPTPDGVIIRVQAQSHASKTGIAGIHGDTPPQRLKIRIAAAPVEGEANEELLRFFKKKLKIPRVQFELIRGSTAKTKDVLCRGASTEALIQTIIEAVKKLLQELN